MHPDLYVISDLHMCDGSKVEDFLAQDDVALVDFLDSITQLPPSSLIINGDFIDFVQVQPGGGQFWFDTELDATEQQSLEKLECVIAAHQPVFAALGRFVAAGHTLRFHYGNHDIDLVWPSLQARLRQELGPAATDDAVIFAESHLIGGLYLEHGHQADTQINCFPDSPHFTKPGPDGVDRLIRCWGTRFVEEFYNKIEVLPGCGMLDNVRPRMKAAVIIIKYALLRREMYPTLIAGLRVILATLTELNTEQDFSNAAAELGISRGVLLWIVRVARWLGVASTPPPALSSPTTPPAVPPSALSSPATPPAVPPPALSSPATPPAVPPPALSSPTTPPAVPPPALSSLETPPGPPDLTVPSLQRAYAEDAEPHTAQEMVAMAPAEPAAPARSFWLRGLFGAADDVVQHSDPELERALKYVLDALVPKFPQVTAFCVGHTHSATSRGVALAGTVAYYHNSGSWTMTLNLSELKDVSFAYLQDPAHFRQGRDYLFITWPDGETPVVENRQWQGAGIRSQGSGVRDQESGIRSQESEAMSSTPQSPIPNSSAPMDFDVLRQKIALLEQEIAELHADLADNPGLSPRIRQRLEGELVQQQAELADLTQLSSGLDEVGSQAVEPQNQPSGGVDASHSSFGDHATVAGRDIKIGTYIARIIYGADLNEQRREQMVGYLQRLAAKQFTLRLHGLAGKLDQGLGLPDIYVLLAISDSYHILRSLTPAELEAYRNQTITIPDDASAARRLPHEAIVRFAEDRQGEPAAFRASLVTDQVFQHQCFVLCGAPGSGKSTFLHHLAWVLAKRGLDQLDQSTTPPGWDEGSEQRWLPVMLSLRTLAGAIKLNGASADTVSKALRTELTKTYVVDEPGDLLKHALDQPDKAILLFDGLDEVPLEATATSADRATTLLAVRDFARLHRRTRVIITCRVRAFTEDLRAELGWPVATIAPWTGGQIRHFVHAWYPQLVTKGAITSDQAERYSVALLAAVFDPARPRLREMAENPLMLTMMALVIASGGGELPRDRPALYEEMLRQLLGQWDIQRDGQSLSQAIGDERIGSDQIRAVLDRLSYEAHRDAISENGHGRIARDDLHQALGKYFASVKVADPWNSADRCIDYFEQRSGLLHPEDDGSTYAFAHLTLQEHCAGRYLLLYEPIKLIMAHRTDDARWREPIFLGVGILMGEALGAGRIEQLLNALIHHCEFDGTPKDPARWQRDLILAAELGADRDWDLLGPKINVPYVQGNLRAGLVKLLGDKSQPLPAAERVRAGFLLGDLGDPRIPVTLDQWRSELAKIERGDETGYFCRLPVGDYLIGSDDPAAPDDQKPQHRYTLAQDLWIARYPMTNSQWQLWAEAGGTVPRFANDTSRNHPTQPVCGVNWNDATAGAAWFSAQLGITLRLPWEREWEAAARGGTDWRYPWGSDWQDDCAATRENRETRGWPWTVPVGCFPAGASPVGAVDLAGNVWEWCQDEWQSYADSLETFHQKNARVLRGGSHGGSRTNVLCAARNWAPPNSYVNFGFRLCVAPYTHICADF